MGADDSQLELTLTGAEASVALGRAIGALLCPGDVVLLVGELGAGKTTLARGLAAGLGVDPAYVITSPTFTLLNVYPGRLDFYHADLYRLAGAEADELELVEQAAAGVLAVEWPEMAAAAWPAGAITVKLDHAGPERRRARVAGPAGFIARLRSACQARED
ncbi:MAG: tRNA (adenosine(37)-N6)-threonylcarbamoyltransferase complex ATPase subunit type 1 TsaE [Thermodesulfobacteriota bacterium]